MKHAIIVTGGKQYRVAEGDVVFVEKLEATAGDSVKFDQVLAVIDGENVVFGKPYKESRGAVDFEHGDNALNGNCDTKWCAGAFDGANWLEVDIGKITTIYKWLVLHCGEFEDKGDNTSDFRLEYKKKAEDEWKTADSVTGNKDDLTVRQFRKVRARYVRLYITKPTQHSGIHCRIYQFHVYKAEK